MKVRINKATLCFYHDEPTQIDRCVLRGRTFFKHHRDDIITTTLTKVTAVTDGESYRTCVECGWMKETVILMMFEVIEASGSE